ncbi:protein FAM221B isoform X2 [Macaca fascicularis]|uniref:protein FAM221B isoform X2 n=1 Tax=Macaca fascicularis TaxID=9541 RepID=UPI0032B068EB
MEADEITEEPHTTMDAEEHPLSKDPSAEDLQENRISESFLEPSTSETPLEPHTSESPLVPSPSQIPVEAYSPEIHQEPSISETPSGTPTYEASLDSPISVVPEKHLTLPPQSRNYVSLSSSDTLKEDLSSEFSSNEVPWTRRSTHFSESESLPEHSPSGPSAQVQMDASEKQEEEAGVVEKGVDASDSTDHTAQPGHQLGKKKKKKGVSCYTARPVVPAKQTELVEVAKAMHREEFGAQVNNLFQWEKDAALNAIQTGLYIGWRCPHYLWDCFRIGDESRCFCGHLLREHRIISDISVPCKVSQCRCLMFCFIPSRPEEAVAAAVLSLISSVRPVTGAGRNTGLSLRPRGPGDEEGDLTEQTMYLLQRCLCSEKPSSATLTSRPCRYRGPLAFPAPTLVPRDSLPHTTSSLASLLTPIPDPFTSALPSSRDRHCQQLAQAFVSLAQISNKRGVTGT